MIRPLEIQEEKKPDWKAILKSHSVKFNERYEKPRYCLSILDKGKEVGIFTLGNFSLLIGKAKSRKSTFLSMATASMLAKSDILMKFRGNMDGAILYFDTEQSEFYVYRIVNTSCILSGCEIHPDNLSVICLREFSPSERLYIIENIMRNTENLIYAVIDGIRDLITDINDAEQATSISTFLMKITKEMNCHVTCVLHQNKNDNNARGHIGTELINKAETVLSINKTSGGDTSLVKCDFVRGLDFDQFEFGINRDGLPYIDESTENISPVGLGDIPF